MAKIIKQPNGLYAIYSSIVGSFTHYDCSQNECVDIFVADYRRGCVEKVGRICKGLDNGEKPYPHTQTFEEVLDYIKEAHGEEEHKKITNLFHIK